jgi:hypothetical protein
LEELVAGGPGDFKLLLRIAGAALEHGHAAVARWRPPRLCRRHGGTRAALALAMRLFAVFGAALSETSDVLHSSSLKLAPTSLNASHASPRSALCLEPACG